MNINEGFFFIVRSRDNCGTCTVAEKNTGTSVRIVHDGRELLRTDDQNILLHPGFNIGFCQREQIDETAACCGDIECLYIPDTQFIGDDTGGRRHIEVIRRHGRTEKKIDIICLESCTLDRLFCCFGTHVTGIFILCCDTAFFDTGTFYDPFIGSIHHFFKIFIT